MESPPEEPEIRGTRLVIWTDQFGNGASFNPFLGAMTKYLVNYAIGWSLVPDISRGVVLRHTDPSRGQLNPHDVLVAAMKGKDGLRLLHQVVRSYPVEAIP